MGSIYKQAKSNLIFLGYVDEIAALGVVRVVTKLRIRYTAVKGPLNGGRRFRADVDKASNGDPNAVLWDEAPIVSQEEVAILDPLFSLPWFQRLWIVQEASLAFCNTCLFGSQSLPLDGILLTAQLCVELRQYPLRRLLSTEGVQGIFAARQMAAHVNEDYEAFEGAMLYLAGFQYLTERLKATDPRDRIFGVLQMFRYSAGLTSIPKLLTPNYAKSAAAVFRDATRYMLEEQLTAFKWTKGDQVLHRICHRSDEDLTADGWTSWTMRLDRDYDPALDWRESDEGYDEFHAGLLPGKLDYTDSIRILSDEHDPNMLSLKGYKVEDVYWASEAVTGDDLRDQNTMPWFCDLVIRLAAKGIERGVYSSTDPVAVTADVLATRSSYDWDPKADTDSEHITAFRAFRQRMDDPKTFPLPTSLSHGEEMGNLEARLTSRYASALWLMLHNRCFSVTSSGRLGLGPKVMQAGDLVYVLPGFQHPFILRQKDELFRFVGQSYIHGLMKGEALDMGLKCSWIDLI